MVPSPFVTVTGQLLFGGAEAATERRNLTEEGALKVGVVTVTPVHPTDTARFGPLLFSPGPVTVTGTDLAPAPIEEGLADNEPCVDAAPRSSTMKLLESVKNGFNCVTVIVISSGAVLDTHKPNEDVCEFQYSMGWLPKVTLNP